ncbi:MAG: hypothetical protein NBV63_01950 [Candidatus Pacebacteria bacterium]|nr:hypothetical protein [Candidatus Paceibacterota bacterium]
MDHQENAANYSVITNWTLGLGLMLAAGALGDYLHDGRLDSGPWFAAPAGVLLLAGLISLFAGGRAGAIGDARGAADAAADDVLNGK